MIKNKFELLIGGDFYVQDDYSNLEIFSPEIISLFEQSNFNIINLEAPVTQASADCAIDKTGPHLKVSQKVVVPILQKLSIDLVTLANNHIKDYGNEGLKDTFKNCKNESFDFVGAGMNLKEAQEPFAIEVNQQKIAILNFAENEWASAGSDQPGANPLDIIDNVKQIQVAKKSNDIVMVIIHGGHEYYNLPSPRMVKQYRFYAENGASVIIGHHPHCISGYEVYQNVPIFYSLGNFLFTIKSKHKEWYTGLLLKLKIGSDLKMDWELIPIQQNADNFSVTLLEGLEKQNVLNEVKEYSQIITNEENLLKSWDQFLKKRSQAYINAFSPANIFVSKYINAGLRLTGLERIFLKKKQYKQILNLIRCEAHADISKAAIENFLKVK